MKKIGLLTITLSLLFTGCFNENDKKAKDIVTKKIIEQEKKEEASKQRLNNKDTRDYSNAFK